jgi:hypothetical protein
MLAIFGHGVEQEGHVLGNKPGTGVSLVDACSEVSSCSHFLVDGSSEAS